MARAEALEMKQGSFVRHRAKPDWGIGRVLLVAGHYSIEFETRGLIKLDAAVAGSHLEILDEAEVPPDHPLRGGKKPRKTTRKK
jgi:transcription elongation factor GreA-like protein